MLLKVSVVPRSTLLLTAKASLIWITLCCVGIVSAQDKLPTPAAVGTGQPTAIVSLTSLEKLIPDLVYLTRITGQPPMIGGMLTMSVNQYTQGVDRTRPIGMAVNLTDEGQPQSILMLPVNDLDSFLAGISNFVTYNELSTGKYQLQAGLASSLYALYKNKWLYVSQFEEDLERIPADPSSLIARLSDRYDIAVSLMVASIPEPLREQILAGLDQGFESALSQGAENMSEEELKASRERGEQAMKQLKESIADTEQLLIGLNVNQQAKAVQLELGTKFVPGSKLAKQTGMQKDLTSQYSDFALTSDPIQMRYRSKISPEDAAQASEQMDMQVAELNKQINNQVDDEAGREVLRKSLQTLTDSLKATIEEGDIDGSYAMNFEGGLNFYAGGRVANAAKLESEVVDLFKTYQNEPGAPSLEGSAINKADMRMYRGTWKVPSNDSSLIAAVGETLPFVMAFGEKKAALAIGVNCERNFEQAFQRVAANTGGKADPFDAKIDLLPILQYAEKLIDDDKAVSIVRAAIAKALEFSASDSVLVTSRAVDNGVIMRLTVEEGIFQASGAAASASAPPPPQRRR